MSEELTRIPLPDGTFIDLHREDTGEMRVCHQDRCAVLDATGAQAIAVFELLESVGKSATSILGYPVVVTPEPGEDEDG